MDVAPPPRVLVVEDEPELAALYRRWLEPACDVDVAHDADEALEALDDATDVVLLDRRLPGPSGDEVLASIRARGVDCRVAMVTAQAPAFDVLALGFDDYLVKPVSAADVEAVVERLVRRSAYTEEVQHCFALATKRAALDAEHSTAERAGHPAYEALEADLERAFAAVDEALADLDHGDVEALFYDLRDAPRAAD